MTPATGDIISPRISVVILNWNGRDDTLACLDSVSRIEYPSFDVIVADNGSDDGSVSAVREQFPGAHIIENGANLGFAGGNNPAISYALTSGADFILLLNNDTVVDRSILAAFVDAAARMPHAGIFGAKIYYFTKKNTLWYAGGWWNQRDLRFGDFGANEIDYGQFDEISTTDWVIGCALFARAEVFKNIGLLEEKFFLNYEEIDFCFRARRAGYDCAYTPFARLWHKVSASFGGDDSPLKIYFNERNRLLWAQRNMSFSIQLRMYLRATCVLLTRMLRPLLGKTISGQRKIKTWWWAIVAEYRNPLNRALAQGYIDFWLRRFGDCPDSIRSLNYQWKTRNLSDGAGAKSLMD